MSHNNQSGDFFILLADLLWWSLRRFFFSLIRLKSLSLSFKPQIHFLVDSVRFFFAELHHFNPLWSSGVQTYSLIPPANLHLNFSKRISFVTLFCMLKLISFILHVSFKFFTSIFKINILFSKLGYKTNFFLKVYYFKNTNP